VVFSPDGKLLASAEEGHAVVLREGATGQELRMLARLRGLVRALALVPDGKGLPAGGRDGTVMVWRLDAGEAVETVRHREPVPGVSF
jgi:WD40 repeat protein